MRKLLLILAAAVGGTFAVAAPAIAQPVESVVHPNSPSTVVRTASDAAPPKATRLVSVRVQPPKLLRVTVRPGDTLTAIGSRTSRSWEQLASYNHIPNPNLIYVGDVETIPPASYVAGPVVLPVPAYTPPVHVYHAAPTRTYTSTRTYTPPVAPVVSSGFQACVISRESGGNAQIRSPSGTYWGLYQFSYQTWVGNGGNPASYGSASAGEQTAVFNRSAPSNWAPYDGC